MKNALRREGSHFSLLSILEGKMAALFASTIGEKNSNAQYLLELV
jgi:hypothetical protein